MNSTLKGGVTRWFPSTINPVRVGHYECKMCVVNSNPINRHYWNGRTWHLTKGDPDTIFQKGWRGLKRSSNGDQ